MTEEEDDASPKETAEAIRRAQAIVRAYLPEDESLSDELISDRRREEMLERDAQPE